MEKSAEERRKKVEEFARFSGQTLHAVLPLVTPDDMALLMRQGGEAAVRQTIARREQIILDEKGDPLRNGWEPPFWWICDAMRAQKFAAPAWARAFPGVDWLRWAQGVRDHYGVKEYFQQFLIEGANRAGKTEYAAKRCVLTLVEIAEAIVWCFHTNEEMSIEVQQKAIKRYIPPEWREGMDKRGGNMSWVEKTGFTGMKFVVPNLSRCLFKTYKQDLDAIEGGQINLGWCDELAPQDVVNTLKGRVATLQGSVLVTFTPIEGYTPTVRMFEDGAKPIMEDVAYLLPRDGGEPDLVAALGFASMDEMVAAHDEGRWSVASKFPFMQEIAEQCRAA